MRKAKYLFIYTLAVLTAFLFCGCNERSSTQESTIDEGDVQATDSNQASTPVFFNDLGKTLSVLESEHPKAKFFVSNYPDSQDSCFGELDAQYAYIFFGGQCGGFEAVMIECKDQLQCAGFLTTAGVLFPEMDDDMSFVDFFSLIGVSDYTYINEEDTMYEGWLEFKFNDMDVWLNTNEIRSDGGWDFTDAKIVRRNAPVNITDKELYHQNQVLADARIFAKKYTESDWVYEDKGSFSDTYNLEDEDWTFDTPFYDINVKLPFININSADAQKVNDIMLAHLADVKSMRTESLAHVKTGDWGGWWFTYYISYESSLNNNLLSLCLRVETSGTDVPYVYYETYNFDIPSRKFLSQEELLTAIGLTSETLDEAVQEAIKAEVENFDNEYNLEEYINTDINYTNEEYKNIKEEQDLQLYVDKTGKLYLYLDVSNNQVGRGYRSALLPLNF